VLGISIGTARVVAQAAVVVCEEAIRAAERAARLSLQSFFLVLRLSVIPKVMHVTRYSDLRDPGILRHFDTRIRAIVLGRLAISAEEIPVPALLEAPVSKGGLGLMQMETARDPALAGAAMSILGRRVLPELMGAIFRVSVVAGPGREYLDAARAECGGVTSFLHLASESFPRLGLVPGAELGVFLQRDGKRLSVDKAQHSLWSACVAERLEAALADPAVAHVKKLVTSCVDSPSSNAFLQCFPSPLFKLTDGEFAYGVQMRLGVDFLRNFYGATCPLCRLPLDVGHERLCRKACLSALTTRHTTSCGSWRNWLVTAGLAVLWSSGLTASARGPSNPTSC